MKVEVEIVALHWSNRSAADVVSVVGLNQLRRLVTPMFMASIPIQPDRRTRVDGEGGGGGRESHSADGGRQVEDAQVVDGGELRQHVRLGWQTVFVEPL